MLLRVQKQLAGIALCHTSEARRLSSHFWVAWCGLKAFWRCIYFSLTRAAVYNNHIRVSLLCAPANVKKSRRVQLLLRYSATQYEWVKKIKLKERKMRQNTRVNASSIFTFFAPRMLCLVALLWHCFQVLELKTSTRLGIFLGKIKFSAVFIYKRSCEFCFKILSRLRLATLYFSYLCS